MPVIESEITIEGNGSTIERDSAADPFRILAVNNNGHLTLRRTTITGGSGRNPADGLDFSGSGIANYGGTLTLTHSTISGNMAYAIGGGVANYDGIATITHSTISGNDADDGGGGVFNDAYSTLALTNSTISGNTAREGGGVYNGFSGLDTILTLNHTLISGNKICVNNNPLDPNAKPICDPNEISVIGAEVFNRSGTINASNHNLFGHSGLTNAQAFENFTPSGSDITTTSNGATPTELKHILEVDSAGKLLLQGNGGLTETIALVEGGPAIDVIPKADCSLPPLLPADQRGYTRPVDGNGDGAAECDIGAFEFGVSRLSGDVALAVLRNTLSVTPGAGAKGCPLTFEGGAFSFKARLRSKSGSPPFTHLGVQVTLLTQGNELLLNDVFDFRGGAGIILPVPDIEGYSDEILKPKEQVDIPFTICLKSREPFMFRTDMFGVAPLDAHFGDKEGSPSAGYLFEDPQGKAKEYPAEFEFEFNPQALPDPTAFNPHRD